ncbi:MAG: diacylglycerol kinase family protein [Chitinophagales bacterium]
MDETWFVLVNPAAGGFKAKKKWPAISLMLQKEGIDFICQFSKSAEDIISTISEAIQKGFRKFIAVGGDGTLNLIINGIFSQHEVSSDKITVAIIPIGTGNDWIRTHRISKSAGKAIALIKSKKISFHDVGKISLSGNQNTSVKYFINMAGFGFQGLVAERIEGVSSGIKKGIFAFVLGIFDALFRYNTTQVSITLDEEEFSGMIYNVNAGICKFCGGGMMMTPDALNDDGLFDITIIRKISKSEVIRNVPGLFSGRFINNRKVSQHRTKKMRITSIPFMPAECDGEVLGYGNVTAEILPKAIIVVVP